MPDNLVAFSRIGALAYRPSSAFDSGANGFTLGEGIGAVLLKRLDQAQRDGDRVSGEPRHPLQQRRGRPQVHDPQLSGQVRLLQEGLANTGLSTRDLGYLECHGTATPVGNQVELHAWRTVLGRAETHPFIGSVKSNLGHTISAAGVAGLIRATLASPAIPPHAGWKEPHPI